jgi:energy-coupling factor transport system substrate-specific component
VATGLQQLRVKAGGPSYAEIAARVAALRESRGHLPAASRVARSTVYDVFRAGRSRLNPELVGDIVMVLGGTDAEAEDWRRRCRVSRSEPLVGAQPAPAPAAETAQENRWLRPDSRVVHGLFVLGVIALAVAVNVAGTAVVLLLPLPFYLDMVGTAIAAIAFGPWYGVAAAAATHALVAATHSSMAGVPYALVNVVGALLWGYGVRSWRLGRTPLRFLGLNVLVAVACTIVAAPITLVAYGGVSPNVGASGLSDHLAGAGAGILFAVVASNIITSVADKLIAGFVALAVAPSLMAFRDRATRPGGNDADLFRIA